jgi:hypothetical protein
MLLHNYCVKIPDNGVIFFKCHTISTQIFTETVQLVTYEHYFIFLYET